MELKAPELGEKIRDARKRAHLSHDRLGLAAGTSRQHLIRLEKGWHRPSDQLLARIAEATGQPLEFFDDAKREEHEHESSTDDDEETADLAMSLYRVLGDLVDAQLLRHGRVLARSA